MSDQRVREALERLPIPEEPPDFFDDLWLKAEQEEREAARRWRRIAVALITLVFVAGTAAGVFAVGRGAGATVVDRTIACRVITNLDSGSVYIGSEVRLPPDHVNGGVFYQPGSLWVAGNAGAKPQLTYVQVSKLVKGGYSFDGTICKKTAAIPLARSGLPSLGTFSRAGNARFDESCDVAKDSLVTVRIRVTELSANEPTGAVLAIRSGRRQRPTAFVEWTPTRVRAWLAAGCIQR
ncbi:MAG TPA: hypothetical protein VFM96_05380 [Gaiellaceae bacterium]|nr:hypothetical protein [Gaiellaceae bacterium]